MDWRRAKFLHENLESSRNWHPTFVSEEFQTHTYARKKQLRGVIGQNGKPIAFYSQKLTPN